MMSTLVNVLLNALLIAGLYASMSYGLAVIYGVMKIINLVHAGLMMFAAYVTLTLFEKFHVDPALSVLIVFPLFYLGGVVVYRLAVQRLPRSESGPTIESLLLTFGFWLVLQNLAYRLWSGDDQSILTSYTLKVIHLGGGLTVSVPRLITFGVGVLSLVVLEFVMQRTFLGKAVRAVTQNRSAAMLVGINAEKINAFAYGLGTAFAGLAGSLMALLYAFNPDFGRNFLLKAFCIIVLGGMESFTGVAVGALVVALVENFSSLALPTTFQDAITFGLLVVALVVFPQGISGLWERLRGVRAR